MKGNTPGLLVGLEIHQQLDSGSKLFCDCPPGKSEQLPYRFERRLRPAQSEVGRVDPAAIFEFSKGKSNTYLWNPETACLVEADEEPPHSMNGSALESTILVALALGSKVVDEVHVMRKIVIDGSNTSGFQRTAVVGLGGSMEVDGAVVGVQSVTVEEDAARILGEEESSRQFALDRLGTPLVEVALEPIRGDPESVGRVALHLGRILRSTGRVARGLGTIRQDLNVSLDGGKVVEVKGVQKLNLLPKVVGYEAKRQRALIEIGERVREHSKRLKCRVADVTSLARASSSPVLSRNASSGGQVNCIGVPGLEGLLGWEPVEGFRLGKELAEVARANSLGGVIHSDEFERQGIPKSEASGYSKAVDCGQGDALVLVAGPSGTVATVVPLIVSRLESAGEGVPAETRSATEEGETRYIRPRPGSQRMYPETDVPDMAVAEETLARVRIMVPEPWEATVSRLVGRYSISREQSLRLADEGWTGEFETLCSELRLVPSLIASTLVEVPPRLSREGVDESALGYNVLAALLRAVDSGRAAKEAIPEILRVAGRKNLSVDEAIDSLGIEVAGEVKVREVVERVLTKERQLLAEKGEGAFSPLMGEVMKELRGKADGELVSRVLKQSILDRNRHQGR